MDSHYILYMAFSEVSDKWQDAIALQWQCCQTFVSPSSVKMHEISTFPTPFRTQDQFWLQADFERRISPAVRSSPAHGHRCPALRSARALSRIFQCRSHCCAPAHTIFDYLRAIVCSPHAPVISLDSLSNYRPTRGSAARKILHGRGVRPKHGTVTYLLIIPARALLWWISLSKLNGQIYRITSLRKILCQEPWWCTTKPDVRATRPSSMYSYKTTIVSMQRFRFTIVQE